MPILQWLLKNVVLDWLFAKIKSIMEAYKRKKDIEGKVHEDIQQLKDAKSAEEVENAAVKLADDF